MEDCICMRVKSYIYTRCRKRHWFAACCSTKVGEKLPEDDKKPEPPSESKGMSGIGIFFCMFVVFTGVYFIGGAIYNFKMYNARGLDLIPHRGKKKK